MVKGKLTAFARSNRFKRAEKFMANGKSSSNIMLC